MAAGNQAEYDAIVLGVGAVGSAALYHLAKRGARVLGIERFEPGHDRGSSHGETRVIRTAYHEHPDYVPLLQRAVPLWLTLESEVGEKLYWEVGCLEMGPPDGEVVPGVLRAADEHGLAVEQMTGPEVEARFPGFQVPEGFVGVYEEQGGVLAVEACIRAHVQVAQERGATLWSNTEVLGWCAEGDGFLVDTSNGSVRAGALVIAAGAWASMFLPFLDVPLRVVRKPLLWYGAKAGSYPVSEESPVFLYEMPEGLFYGFPCMEDGEIKIAEHSGGHSVADPLHPQRDLMVGDREPVEAFLETCMPHVHSQDFRRSAVCMYTSTPDSHFLVGSSPDNARVHYAAGLSGHGFKFSAVLGEVLAGLALDGESPWSIEVFSASRFEAL